MRRAVLIVLSLGFAGLALLGLMHWEARRTPVVRRAAFALPGWPAGAPPVTIAVLGDLHIGNAAMPVGRLERVVQQVNALRPDLVVLAGDFIAGHERRDAASASGLAALEGLRAPLGVMAVLGNHDHWTDARAVRSALARAKVRVLTNEAVRVGPLALGGLDDAPTGYARLDATVAAMRDIGGAPVLLAHSPELPGAYRGLVLAGHTHCGQIVLRFIGAPMQVTAPRYRCGIVRETGRVTVVTAGVGTSVLPLRFGAPPDLWLIRLGPG